VKEEKKRKKDTHQKEEKSKKKGHTPKELKKYD
jgi:hypothetical protein